MKSILEAGDLKNKRVLVRVDWNAPLDYRSGQAVVADDFRIKKSLPTLEYLKGAGAKVVIATHLEPKGTPIESLKTYVPEGMKLLGNLRDNPGEEDNSEEFAKELTSKVDIYVNEAFSVTHREHASIVRAPRLLPGFIGLQFALEIKELSKAFYPKKPFLFIIGGAKFDTKLPLLKKFIHIADHIFVGGALANNFFKEQGVDVGNSLVSEGDFGLKELLKTGKIILPEDTIIKDGKILDAGPKAIENLKPMISTSKLVLWNGPLGNYENGYGVATLALARMISESSCESIIGGGHTIAAIKGLNLFDKFSFVSTGGGAMLDFLATGTLPGIEALKQ